MLTTESTAPANSTATSAKRRKSNRSPDTIGLQSKYQKIDDAAKAVPVAEESKRLELGDSVCSLLEKSRQGCERSREDLLQQLRAYVAVVASSKMNSRYQAKFGESDIVQQSLAAAVEHFERFRGNSEGELFAWVKQILTNQLRQNQRALRSEKRDLYRERSIEPAQSGMTGPALPDPFMTPGTDAMQREASAALDQAMQQLPEEYRQVIQLRNWEKLPFAEIGKRMDRTANAATKLWYRALIMLRKKLEVFDV